MKLAIIGILLLILFFFLIPPTPPVKAPVDIQPPHVNEHNLEILVNKYRVSNGLTELPEDSNLCSYASTRAEQIKTEWDHVPFMNNRCATTGYGTCGENLAYGYSTEESTLNGWINSRSHRENLNRNWTATCIKCSGNYCAQEFGK